MVRPGNIWLSHSASVWCPFPAEATSTFARVVITKRRVPYVIIVHPSVFRGEGSALDPAPDVESLPEQRPSRDEHSELNEVCLARDGNRCAITGLYDMVKAEDLPPLDRRQVGMKGPTVSAYSLPFALGRFKNETLCTEVSQLDTNRPSL
jgi:hypothetical protein